MHKFLIAAIFSCIHTVHISAQDVSIDYSSPGNLVLNREGVVGSPFFYNEYSKGSIQLLSGKIHDDLNLKINLQSQKIIVALYDGVEVEITSPISKVTLYGKNDQKPVVFLSGLPIHGKQNERSIYQVLDSGKIMLLKFTKVRFENNYSNVGSKLYNQRTYLKTPDYYVWSPGKELINISLNENELLATLRPFKNILLDIIHKEKIQIKKETDLIRIITLLNQSVSLKPINY
jgi:hypothetical protein